MAADYPSTALVENIRHRREKFRRRVEMQARQQKMIEELGQGWDEHLCDLAAEINSTELALSVTF
jgi:hypothetical protein